MSRNDERRRTDWRFGSIKDTDDLIPYKSVMSLKGSRFERGSGQKSPDRSCM